jgi:hypothetical protein
MATNSPSIEVRGLTKGYGKTVAVADLSSWTTPKATKGGG